MPCRQREKPSANNGGRAALKALEATAEADAYAMSLKEAARFCIEAAGSHDTVAAQAPKSETAAKDDEVLAKEDKTPAKNEKAPAHVA
jgi:hypothetical protein